MSGIFYLKKGKDIALYGHQFDEFCYDLDANQVIDLVHPERKLQMSKKIGNGRIIKDTGQFTEADFKTSTYFGAGKNDKTLFTLQRKKFLMEWVYTTDEVWLYKNDGINFGRMRVYPTGKAKEKYKNYIFVEYDHNFECSQSFFDSINPTSITFQKDKDEFICQFNNQGTATPFIFQFTPDTSIDGLVIKLFENLGIAITDFILQNNVIKIETRNMRVSINDVERKLNMNGTPFNLETGINNLKVKCTATGTIVITYYERFI